ncbi:PAS domain-containing sensor histidine kinase [Mucilaginibacter galii]|uniref:histidine kinase n=1 Tax=Mucilaginibacter galii TaxID=2005073 RepID=A0A917J7K8_9SPHI|nr:PAS domain-containing sensor histidine kinase [Mucilaginibacter galii]GGI50543.1 PAS domain-containing sensor histidine kinase [Mucilaginibacter galii]
MLPDTEEPEFSAGSFYQTDNQLKRLFMQTQSLMAILKWREGVCELINPMFKSLWANREVLNIPMRQAWPELGHCFYKKVEQVFDTGKTRHSYEYAVDVKKGSEPEYSEAFFDFVYSPYTSHQGDIEGVMVMGFDVTAKVQARRELAEQQLLFKDITDAAGTALWTVDTRGNITFVNHTWIDWTGSPYEAHLGRGWIEYVQPEDRDRVIGGYIREVNHRAPYEVDFRVLRSDGKTQWVAATGKPRYLPNGEFAGYVGSCMDITERKKSEQMLKASEERFRSIADSAPVLIWMAGVNKHTTFLNKSWTHYGSEMQLLSDSSYLQSDLLHEHDRDRVLDTYTQAFDARHEFYMEYRMKSRYDDRYRWIGMKGVPCIGADGTFEGYIGSGMDISAMKEHEQIKNDFIGMASHELKTPITSIKAYIQLLLTIYRNKTDDDFLMKSLNTVNKQINKLTRLITDLLDVSKMETGRLSLNCELFVLNDLLKEIVEEVQHTATQHDIVMSTPQQVTIYADRDRIGQVITNFLTNAIKYSPESDRVDVILSINNNEAVIAVQDYGIGISPDEQSKIFNRFYRVEGRNEQTFSGFGIGLYVAAEIVKRHDGNVWVESQKDKGSVFYFTIPQNFED